MDSIEPIVPRRPVAPAQGAAAPVSGPVAQGAAAPAAAPGGAPRQDRTTLEGGKLLEGAGGLFSGIRDAFKIPKVEATDQEKAAIDRMIAKMPELAGADGKFNRGDEDAIAGSLRPELSGRVDQEICRRKEQAVRKAPPILRPLKRLGANIHVNRNYDDYHAKGMQQADGMVRSGLQEGFDRMGAGQSKPDPDSQRNLSVADLEQYGKDAKALEAISARAKAKGLPEFTFPNGMAVEDLKAIREGRMPPNGRMKLPWKK